MSPTLSRLLLLACACCAAFPVLGGTEARVPVVARVLPYASVDVREGPIVFNVSAADLQRGYVEVPEPLLLAVRTNLPSGAWLEISSPSGHVLRTEIRRADGVPANGSRLLVPQGASMTKVLMRVYLGAGMSPGSYPFPVQIATGA